MRISRKFTVMKKSLIILSVLRCLCPAADAQLWKLHKLEISGGIGSTQFFGDIGGYSNSKNILGIRDFTFLQTRFDINGNIRYRITEDISVRFNLVSGLFRATDARGSNESRGFESSTIFLEPAIIGEYYFIKNKEENSFVFMNDNETLLKSFFKALDFYAFAGFGGLVYKVTPNNILAPHVTNSSGFTEVVPLGIGVSMIYNSKINFGVELGGRFTYSDGIDGYASLKSTANDVYHMLNFTVTYKIKSRMKDLPVSGR
jgi:hypothetical protein